MDPRAFVMIIVIFSALPSTFVAAPFKTAGLKYLQNELLSGKAAASIQEVDVSPEEQKKRDEKLCDLLMHVFKFVFHMNLPTDKKFCEVFREHEKPDPDHQKRLYDFILKHLMNLNFDNDDPGY